MKRLTARFHRWLRHRAASQKKKRNLRRPVLKTSKRLHRQIVDAWFGSHTEKLLVTEGAVAPPRILCFNQNRDETLSFLHSLRMSLNQSFLSYASAPSVKRSGNNWVNPGRNARSLSWIRRYHDYSKIEAISTAAALVLSAEYDRSRRLCDSVPPTINLHTWHPELFRKLYEVGFFEIVGLSEDVAERYRTDGDVRVMRIVSGKDSEQIAQAAENILQLASFIDENDPLEPSVRIALNSSLAEAMSNVAGHAYPTDENFEVSHVGRWWVAASADRVSRELTVVIYDQGASIPVTFPKKELKQHIRDFLLSIIGQAGDHAYSDDAAYIAAALLPGKTQTNQVNRGLGLPEMKELIDISKSGELCIISRGGTCRYAYKTDIVREISTHSIGGTLIQWRLKIDRRKSQDG
ncbi:MAG: hypothetical protein IKG52_11055 [Rhodobacteraceae bacterium]|nr:hypothetical protein [Paracoccaceae bacterium]